MKPAETSLIGRRKSRNPVQNRRSKRKMNNSWRDFQMARSMLQTMINIFLSSYFQCQLCSKQIKPAKVWKFKEHMLLFHPKEEDLKKCQWPGCIYVRTFTDYTLNTLFVQETSHQANFNRHVEQHEGLHRVNCPCCGSTIVR